MEKECAKPGCHEPVRNNPLGRKSKYCTQAHANQARLAKHRAKMQREREDPLWEKVRFCEQRIARFEAQMAGVLPPGHADGCDGNGSVRACCSPGAHWEWPLGQPNELTAEEQEWYERLKADAEKSRAEIERRSRPPEPVVLEFEPLLPCRRCSKTIYPRLGDVEHQLCGDCVWEIESNGGGFLDRAEVQGQAGG